MNGFLNYRSWHLDKVAHILACALIFYVSYDFLSTLTTLKGIWCLLVALLVAIVAAIGKELLDDKTYGVFDFDDIKADFKGIVLGAALTFIKMFLSICI